MRETVKTDFEIEMIYLTMKKQNMFDYQINTPTTGRRLNIKNK